MKKDEEHIKMRTRVKELIDEEKTDEEIAKILNLAVGAPYTRGAVRWYKRCLVAKENQKKAVEKWGYELYSRAGKIAQKKHPWLGHELGKKYGSMAGKRRIKQIKESGKAKEYFTKMAKRLQEVNPNQSSENMKKAIQIMKQNDTYKEHQTEAGFICKKQHPDHFRTMGLKAHRLYPDLAYYSRLSWRLNKPYILNGCNFDSNEEKKACKILIENKLLEEPAEGKNIHFRIKRYDFDFFIQGKIFLEYHPIMPHYRNGETFDKYYAKRRKILDESGFENYPLIVVTKLKELENTLGTISTLIRNHSGASYFTSEKTS